MLSKLIPSRKFSLILNLVFIAVLATTLMRADNSEQDIKVDRDFSKEYKFTNPILDYESVEMKSVSFLYDKVNKKIKELERKYSLLHSSVYFRDLDNGQWIGINEKEPFTTASLIKVPVLIALLKQSEKDSSVLDKKIKVKDSDIRDDFNQEIKPTTTVEVGKEYTILELAERMIKQSDNIAMNLIINNINDLYRTGIFESVGVSFSQEQENKEVLVRVKDYAGFFRVLFNATYLNRENSERALKILSETSFNNGIVAGVPAGVVVSHKFGERSNYINGILSSRQLHDCGVIYYPEKPYILCVMTRGENYEKQGEFIKEVSQYFYKEIENSIRKQ